MSETNGEQIGPLDGVWEELLAAAESDTDFPRFSADLTDGWPRGSVERCVAAGLLTPTTPTQVACCRECPEGLFQEVVAIENPQTDGVSFYLPCPDCGPYRIPAERLRQWTIAWPDFLQAVFAEAPLAGRRRECVPHRVWYLGQADWNGDIWPTYFARGLWCDDAVEVLKAARVPAHAVVFVPQESPPATDRPGPVFIPLADVLTWTNTGLRFNRRTVASRLPLKSPVPTRTRPRKRSVRTAVIDALTSELRAHLRAARDHAWATRDADGVPQLLPKPEQQDLARRCRTSPATVSRCLRDDPAAKVLRYYWQLADNVEDVLAYRER